MTPTTGILRIAFRGDELWGVRDEEGRPCVVVRRVCEMLGLNLQGQLDRLRRTRATVCEALAVASDGKQRRMACVPLEEVPNWLRGIQVGKVAPDLQEMLLHLQLEARDVLAKHFIQKTELAPVAAPVRNPLAESKLDILQGFLDEIRLAHKAVEVLHETVDVHSTQLQEHDATIQRAFDQVADLDVRLTKIDERISTIVLAPPTAVTAPGTPPMTHLSPPIIPLPPKQRRDEILQIVREIVNIEYAGTPREWRTNAYSLVWNRVYDEVLTRFKIPLGAQHKAQNQKQSILDYAERQGYLEPVYACAYALRSRATKRTDLSEAGEAQADLATEVTDDEIDEVVQRTAFYEGFGVKTPEVEDHDLAELVRELGEAPKAPTLEAPKVLAAQDDIFAVGRIWADATSLSLEDGTWKRILVVREVQGDEVFFLSWAIRESTEAEQEEAAARLIAWRKKGPKARKPRPPKPGEPETRLTCPEFFWEDLGTYPITKADAQELLEQGTLVLSKAPLWVGATLPKERGVSESTERKIVGIGLKPGYLLLNAEPYPALSRIDVILTHRFGWLRRHVIPVLFGEDVQRHAH